MKTAYEQLQDLDSELPVEARPALGQWLRAIEANTPISVLQGESSAYVREILSFCDGTSVLALQLHMANEAIQAI